PTRSAAASWAATPGTPRWRASPGRAWAHNCSPPTSASAGRRTVVMVAVALCGLALLAAQAKPGDNFPPAVAATVRVVSAADNCNGSGVIVRRSGPHVYILTAHHVVARASKVEVHVRKASASKPAVYRSAEVVARSAEVDLAVVRLASTDTFPQPL